MFKLLRKLDFAFGSLIAGRDLDTNEALSGFSLGRGVTMTEKVRIKSLVERTRVIVVHVINSNDEIGEEEEGEDEEQEDTEDEGYGDMEMDMDDREGDARWEMEVARVYDRTIVGLGGMMGELE
jgi:Subunit 11 of the general transcription factor TFIIH